MTTETNVAPATQKPSRLDIAVVISSFAVTGLLITYGLHPLGDALFKLTPSPDMLVSAPGRFLSTYQAWLAAIWAKGPATDIVVLLAGLGAVLLKFVAAAATLALIVVVVLPVTALIFGILAAPQAALVWLWFRLRYGPKS